MGKTPSVMIEGGGVVEKEVFGKDCGPNWQNGRYLMIFFR